MVRVRKATLGDLAAVAPVLTRARFAQLSAQIETSPAVTVSDMQGPLAIAGLYPHQDHFEAWFMAAPDARARGGMGAVKILHRLLLALDPKARVVAVVRAGHVTGLRLARVLGFEPVMCGIDGRHVVLALNREGLAIG